MFILWSELAHTVPLNRTFYWFPYSKSLDPLQWEQSDFKSKVTLQYFLASFSIKLILTTKPKSSLAINSLPTIVPLLLHFGPPHPTHSNCSGHFFFLQFPVYAAEFLPFSKSLKCLFLITWLSIQISSAAFLHPAHSNQSPFLSHFLSLFFFF